MSTNSRVLNIEGAINFRDMGGYQGADGKAVKWKSLYRSGQLDRLSDVGVTEVAKLGITSIVDLRFTQEWQTMPTIPEAVPNASFYSWHEASKADQVENPTAKTMQHSWRDSLESGDPVQVREAMRSYYPQKLYSHQAVYRQLLLLLANNKVPVLFHCAAGKDRTGVAAAIVLALLGVDQQQIVDDYLLTQKEMINMDAFLAGGAAGAGERETILSKLGELPKELVQPIFDADLAYIETLLDYVDSEYGGFTGYAQKVLMIDDSVVSSMRANLLES